MNGRIAVAGLGLGCGAAAEPAPPSPPPAPAPVATPIAPDAPARPIHANPPSPRSVEYTPRDAAGRPVFLNPDGTCFVFLPVRPGSSTRSVEAVACPPELADPAWKACAPGEIHRSWLGGDDAGCVCRPQPPGEARPVACPAHDPPADG